ncbi:MAG TPA: hypothetical protein VHM19_18645 [Polyangiales bacterium]|jgi:hypothetical protein|nr:hypothetical protein [Polyangiales bacterium]
MEPKPITCTRRLGGADVYHLRAGIDWCTFIVIDDPARRQFTLAIDGSYGSYAYTWSHPGSSFHKFLRGLDWHYASKKLTQGERDVLDPEETTKEIRRRVCELRREKRITAERAREEWERGHVEDQLSAYEWWNGADSKLFDQAHECIAYKPGPRFEQCRAMYEKFWKAFAEQLGEEASVAA